MLLNGDNSTDATPEPTCITGAAGFIGFHVARRFLELGHRIIGIDSLVPYYDVSLKEARLALLQRYDGFQFVHADLVERSVFESVVTKHRPDRVIHLAAQPGVRYSLEKPQAYIDSNIVAFMNILEVCRYAHVPHLIYASSSSVYGLNERMPFSTKQNVDHPVSLYAATKKANELMAHTYSHLFRLPTTGLRFFTVYGPWGRPDMAIYGFTDAIARGLPIRIYNHGKSLRDFTYIDDAVEAVTRVSSSPASPDPSWSGAKPNPSTSSAPYRIYNVGNHQPVAINELITMIECELGTKANRIMLDTAPGEVEATYADVSDLERDVGFRPNTTLVEGIRRFVAWYRDYWSHNANASGAPS
jgi:UDP-glucuronate 4-epimerase